MAERLTTLWPEIVLFLTTCIVMVVGLSPRRETRRLCPWLCAAGLAIAGVFAVLSAPALLDWARHSTVHNPGTLDAWIGGFVRTVVEREDGSVRMAAGGTDFLPGMAAYGKALTALVGLLLLLLVSGTVDRDVEAAVDRGGRFDPLRATTAEFYSFFLFSLTGLMLVAGADDLIWLFLALELTSLPTYIMVGISTARNRSLEAAVKYFFLGALGAAVFLYGFALLYGAAGTTNLDGLQQALAAQSAGGAGGGLNAIALLGLLMAALGLCFKIAAVPMHYYTPDVYQGAAAPVSAFLAFTPKAAGFFGLLLIAGAAGWHHGGEASGGTLPEALRLTLWAIAAMTMTVGNVLAWLQTSIKRLLAYSSIAHSGYMLVGVIAGPGETFAQSGVSAVLFYLLIYGTANMGAFAVVAAMERRRLEGGTPDGTYEEADSFDDIAGLCRTRPVLGWTMVLSAAGLLGLPPLVGFFGKLPLFTSGIAAGEIVLVVILGLNSAIAAAYYLRLIKGPLLDEPVPAPNRPELTDSPFTSRRVAGVASAVAVVLLAVIAGPVTQLVWQASVYSPGEAAHAGTGEGQPPLPEAAAGVAPLTRAAEPLQTPRRPTP